MVLLKKDFIRNTKHTFWCNLNSADPRFPREHKLTNSELNG